jgi:hypothetical protein
MASALDVTAFGLSVLHGLILTGILVGLIRLRHQMLFSKAIIALVSLFALFLAVDGIVSGPYSVDIGLPCGAVIAIVLIRLYDSRHRTGNHSRG